jgi:hypothetical protein
MGGKGDSGPDWTESDPNDPTLMRAFGAIGDADEKILRVVYGKDKDTVRVVTAFFDTRAAKRRSGP